MIQQQKNAVHVSLSSDRALVDPGNDRLGYAPFAKQLAHGLLRGCPSDGLVVALYGAWGTGKTTVLNFILHYLENDPQEGSPIIVHFNPWWFSGQEDLVRRFFGQFEASLFKGKAQRRKLLKKVSAFSDAVAAMPVPYVAGAAKAVKAITDSGDVVALKGELTQALSREAMRVVVVMDDIDRLTADEIRQLFQVIKAIADFPNVIYLLAFDHEVVVRALEGCVGGKGDDYLEKIVQVPFAIPPSDSVQLQTLLFERLNRLLGDVPPELFDQQHWGNVYLDGIAPFIRKPRDVVRLTNALSVTHPAVAGEVNVVDFIAIEALRIFAPVAYDAIRSNSEMFSGSTEGLGNGQYGRDQRRAFYETWLTQLGTDRSVVERLVARLFPRFESSSGNTVYGNSSLRSWRKTLRVCSPEVFPTYFRLSIPEGQVAAELVRNVMANASDPEFLGNQLLALAREKRPDGHTRATSLLTRLNDHLDRSTPQPVLTGLLNALFDVGDELVQLGKVTSTPFDLGDEYHVSWLLQAILNRMEPQERGPALTTAIRNGRALMIIVRQVHYFGCQHGKWGEQEVAPDEKLVAEGDLFTLEQIARGRLEEAGRSGDIWKSVAPLTLLSAWSMYGDASEARSAVERYVQDDESLIKFVSWFVTRVHSSGMSDRTSSESLRLNPKNIESYADVNSIAARVSILFTNGRGTPEQRAALVAFEKGKRAMDAGKDPMGLFGFDES